MPRYFNKNILTLFLLLAACLWLGGCATIGAVTNGFFQTLVAVIKLPLEALKVIADILNKLPRPPPGVIPGL